MARASVMMEEETRSIDELSHRVLLAFPVEPLGFPLVHQTIRVHVLHLELETGLVDALLLLVVVLVRHVEHRG